MQTLSYGFAGAAGILIFLGALGATPTSASDQGANARTSGTASRAASPRAADPALDPAAAPDLGECDRLRVEEGNQAVFRLYAEGVQIYRWNGTSWGFVAPEADLFADAGMNAQVGIHYAGPTWESVSGSKVVAAVAERCTPDPDSIQWLKLAAVASQGPGMFDGVTFIQRVNTHGGIAPGYSGSFVGEVVRVPYTTEYVFYK